MVRGQPTGQPRSYDDHAGMLLRKETYAVCAVSVWQCVPCKTRPELHNDDWQEAMAARRRLKDIEGQRARLARKVVSSSAMVVRPAAAAHEPDGGPECQPNADAPLLRDEGARRKWVEEELFRCCEVGALLQQHASGLRGYCASRHSTTRS